MSSSSDHTPYSTPPRLIPPAPACRKLSFSSSSPSHSCHSSTSSSSFFSFNDLETPPLSPIPTNSSPSPHLKGIPFSWEQVPGLPKHHHLQHFKIKNSSISPPIHGLPLPPAHPITKNLQIQHDHTPLNPKKQPLHHSRNRFQIRGDHDPFLAAFLECSKDNDDHDEDEDEDDDGNFWRANNSKVSRTLSDRFGFIRMYTSCKSTCAVSESIVYLPRPTPHCLVNGRRRRRHRH